MTRVFLSVRPSVSPWENNASSSKTIRDNLTKFRMQVKRYLYFISYILYLIYFIFYILYFIFYISYFIFCILYFEIFGLLVIYFSLTLFTNDVLIEVLFVMLRSL